MNLSELRLERRAPARRGRERAQSKPCAEQVLGAPVNGAIGRDSVSRKAGRQFTQFVGVLAAIGCLFGVTATGSPQTNAPAAVRTHAPPPIWLARLGSRGVRIHDPSTILKCKEEYWVFYTGRGIPSYHSKDLQKWQPGPPVFTNALPWVAGVVPTNVSGRDFWAPDVIHYNDRYLLYFAVSSFGKNTSAIGLATNPTLDPTDPQYHWTDHGVVIQSNPSDDFNAIDPTIIQDNGGNLWMAFGSFWSGIKLIELDPTTGKRFKVNSPVFSLAHSDSIEAAYLYFHGGSYYLFVDWGLCCRGTNSTYNIRVGRSDSITGPYLDRDGKDMLLGGGSPVLGSVGSFIGPGHAGIVSTNGWEFLSCHFYDGTRHGMPTLAILPLHWGIGDWPEIVQPPVQ